jgi:ABC-type uncharacterized transport system permease subunit
LIVEAVFTIVHGSSTLTTPHFLSQSTVQIFGAFVTWEQIIVTVISLGAAVALYVFFRTARLGKAMRAVVDDPDLLGLAGTSPERVRRWAWVIGCVFAAASGVLLAPSVPLDPNVLTLLIVQAFGAAAIGRFTSLPLTLAGGLAIGIVSSILTEYINSTSLLAGLPPSLPFIVLFLVILFSPRGRLAVRQFGLRRAQIPWQAPGRVQLVGIIAVAAFLITGAVLGRLPDHRLDPGPDLRDPAALARPARQDLRAGIALPHHVRGHRGRRVLQARQRRGAVDPGAAASAA